jgi:transposase
MARRTKRLWTDEEKRSICFQTTAPGVSVAQVARRYAVNANLIFKWLRDPRFAPNPAAVPSPAVEPRFLPVEIVGEAKEALMAVPTADSHIEIELAEGHRMRISGGYDPEALARLIRGLSA